jgi:glycerophosphoryl diester phosphodiesterase
MNAPTSLSFREALARGFDRPLAIAHRGDSFHAPENTLTAARLGHSSGADGWEFDVQRTRDGVPIVIHDSSLRRTTNVARRFRDDSRSFHDFPVADFTLDEIRRLDAGSWFLEDSGGSRTATSFGTSACLSNDVRQEILAGSIGIPTLDDALSLTVELGWLANVEVKSGFDGDFQLVDAVVAAIDRLGAAEHVLVSSFDHAEVARVAARAPWIATGILCSTPIHRPAYYTRQVVGADAYHVSLQALGGESACYRSGRSAQCLRITDIRDCCASNIPVLVYTVNEIGRTKMAGHLAEAGVAGLITDDPCSLVSLLTPS